MAASAALRIDNDYSEFSAAEVAIQMSYYGKMFRSGNQTYSSDLSSLTLQDLLDLGTNLLAPQLKRSL